MVVKSNSRHRRPTNNKQKLREISKLVLSTIHGPDKYRKSANFATMT